MGLLDLKLIVLVGIHRTRLDRTGPEWTLKLK